MNHQQLNKHWLKIFFKGKKYFFTMHLNGPSSMIISINWRSSDAFLEVHFSLSSLAFSLSRRKRCRRAEMEGASPPLALRHCHRRSWPEPPRFCGIPTWWELCRPHPGLTHLSLLVASGTASPERAESSSTSSTCKCDLALKWGLYRGRRIKMRPGWN